MTYAEYSKLIGIYESAQSLRKSLQMIIRMNSVWLSSRNSKRGLKRVAKIEAAQKQLDELVVPVKPIHPIGYQVIDKNDSFVGFYATDDKEYIKQEAEECLGHTDFTLKAELRYRDD